MVGSNQRERKMSAETLVQTLVLGCLETGQASLTDWVGVADDLGCAISASSLDERLNSRLVLLLYAVLTAAIRYRVGTPHLPIAKLKTFRQVICYDSTRIALSPIFKDVFADTTAGHSSLKVQLGYDYLSGQLVSLDFASGIQPDQKDRGLLAQAQAGVCLCCDLGYFEQHQLQQLDEQDASFIMPYQSQTALYDLDSGERMDLAAQLRNQSADTFSATYALGAQARHPLRIVARRLPTSRVERRQRHANQRAKRDGYTRSQAHRELLAWHILVTNLDASWTVEDIFTLYGVRWQIELIFKGWKSYLEIEPIGYWRRERIFAQLLATLIGAVLCQTTFALVRWVEQAETSAFRTIVVLKRRITRLCRVIRRQWYGLAAWARDLRQALLRLARQQNLKTSPSTLYRLMDEG